MATSSEEARNSNKGKDGGTVRKRAKMSDNEDDGEWLSKEGQRKKIREALDSYDNPTELECQTIGVKLHVDPHTVRLWFDNKEFIEEEEKERAERAEKLAAKKAKEARRAKHEAKKLRRNNTRKQHKVDGVNSEGSVARRTEAAGEEKMDDNSVGEKKEEK